ncbi:isocitrate dehydrogenase kinase/phosphatase AceK regulatory subunit, partial [Escherichia coli]
PTYRAYYPGTRDGLGACFERIVHNFQLNAPFEDLERDIGYVVRAVGEHFGDFRIAPNFQIHVLSSLFFRNKAAYIIGRVINGDKTFPLAVPILRNAAGQLSLDTVLLRQEQLLILFSFTHSYFMVDME